MTISDFGSTPFTGDKESFVTLFTIATNSRNDADGMSGHRLAPYKAHYLY